MKSVNTSPPGIWELGSQVEVRYGDHLTRHSVLSSSVDRWSSSLSTVYFGQVRIFAARSAGGRRRYRLRGRRRIRHMVSGNPFNNAVSADEKSADVTAEHSKGANTNVPEFAVRSGVRCCRLWFRRTVLGIMVDEISSVNVAVQTPDTCIAVLFIPFLCTDQVPVCGWENTVHSAEGFYLCLPVRSRLGCDRLVNGKRGGRATEDGLERDRFCRPVDVVVLGGC